MTLSRDSHEKAMDLALFADRERSSGNSAKAKEMFARALNLELDAISSLEVSEGLAWDILHRSAGWLALDCDQPRLAEKLACTALAGEPDLGMATQLREVLTEAHKRMETESKAA